MSFEDKDLEEDEEPDTRLGKWEVQRDREGGITAKITGDGFFTVGHSRDASLISDRKLLDRFDEPQKWVSLDNIIPEEWSDKPVKFEITVKAKRIPESERGK